MPSPMKPPPPMTRQCAGYRIGALAAADADALVDEVLAAGEAGLRSLAQTRQESP